MEITEAKNYREQVTALLSAENLPVSDLPTSLDNFLVAKNGNEIIGVIGLEIYNNNGLLRSLAVKADHRNLGIAAKLISAIEELATSRGLHQICLLTETASGYFSRMNFITISRADVPDAVQRSSEFSYVCPQSAVVMEKTLIRE